jgi:hypothetical protein
MIIGQINIEEEESHFFIPLIDTWGLNMRRDPKNRSGQKIEHDTTNCLTYHTNSRDNSPYDKCCPVGIELQANTKTEDQAWCYKPPFTTNQVSHWECEKRAEKSSSRENRYLSNKIMRCAQRRERGSGWLTTRLLLLVGRKKLPAPIPSGRFSWNVPNVSSQSCMAMIPPIVPVSYLFSPRVYIISERFFERLKQFMIDKPE